MTVPWGPVVLDGERRRPLAFPFTRMAQKAYKSHMSIVPALAGLALSSYLAVGCGAAGPRESCRPDSSGIVLTDGEAGLERVLHELDRLDVELYPFKDAPGNPIAACLQSSNDLAVRALAWRLMMGKTAAGQEKEAEKRYYGLLQQGTPAELLPIVQLRKYYKEGLRRCLVDSNHEMSQAAREESAISMLSTQNFEAATSKGIVVIDFMAHWCGPCKVMTPDLEKLARTYKDKLKVGRMNLDRNIEFHERYHIKELPTLVVLDDGREVARQSDGRTYAAMKVWIDRVLQEHAPRETGRSD